MISAFLHRILAYALMFMCQLSGHACAYGAETVTPPAQLNIKLPAGFKINVFSHLGEAVGQPRMMAFDSQGRLYVALASTNKIVMLPDVDSDGLAEAPIVIANNLNAPNSIAFIDDNTMLIGNQDGVVVTKQINAKWSMPKLFISNLSSGGHTLKTVKIGPDRFIYLNVGSSCNVCVEADPTRATILRYTIDGKPAGDLETAGRHAGNPIWAQGLRNSQGFAWHPKTQSMFATNNGADMRSDKKGGKVNDELPPEHFNKIEPGKHYGWPHCWADHNNLKKLAEDPNFPGAENFCKSATPPAITFTSHATPIGVTFLNQTNWPADYQTDAVVALHGSWNRKTPSGYRLVRVKFIGEIPIETLDFATGWLNIDASGNSQAWGRPTDVIVGTDGALYVSDDRASIIYRISYKKAP